jgi:hypothetical protein
MPNDVCLLDILNFKKDIGVMILKPKNYMSLWMPHFVKQNLITLGVFLALLFRGRLILKRMVYKKVEEEMNL